MTPRLQDAMNTLSNAVSAAINNAGVTYPGITPDAGWPVVTELVKALSPGSNAYFVAVFPLGSPKNVTRYSAYDRSLQIAPTVTLTATVASSVITFGGTVAAGYNVHTFVGNPLHDVAYKTVAGDTLSSIATNVAAAINAASVSGVTATPSGATVTVTGGKPICNVGGSGSISREVGRRCAMFQVSVYAVNPTVRYAAGDAIASGIGGSNSHHLALSDGSDMFVNYQTDRLIDKNQSSYSCFEWHFTFECEYSQVQTVTATQIEGVTVTDTLNTNTTATTYVA